MSVERHSRRSLAARRGRSAGRSRFSGGDESNGTAAIGGLEVLADAGGEALGAVAELEVLALVDAGEVGCGELVDAGEVGPGLGPATYYTSTHTLVFRTACGADREHEGAVAALNRAASLLRP